MLPGFKPVSEVTSAEGMLDEAVLEEARKADVYGVLMEGGEMAAAFVANERDGAAPLVYTFAELERGVATAPTLKGAKAVSIRTPRIAGVVCSRIEVELITSEVSWRRLAYVVPGGKRWAALAVIALPARYPPLAQQLDALVENLPGIVETDSSVRPESSRDGWGKAGIIAASVVGLSAIVRALYRHSLANEKPKKE